MVLNLKNAISKYGLNIKNVIHVGGHHGHEVALYKEITPDCQVVLFEPHPNTFKIMCDNVSKFKGIVTHNVALGDQKTVMSLYVETANAGQSNSLLQPALHTRQYPNIVFNNKIEVIVDTLDSYELGRSFNFMSIDVQGYELYVLKGATQTLDHIDYIITEVNNAELYSGCCMISELDEYLSTYNFLRVETDWIGGTWGDALYIKNKNLN